MAKKEKKVEVEKNTADEVVTGITVESVIKKPSTITQEEK